MSIVRCQKYFDELFKSNYVISFEYGDISSLELFSRCERVSKITELEDFTVNTILYSDNLTGLNIEIVCKMHKRYSAVEWCARFINEGDRPTPIIKNVSAQNVNWTSDSNVKLRYSEGACSALNEFKIVDVGLTDKLNFELFSTGGTSSEGKLPMFNLYDENQGIISMIGWTGQWKTVISSNSNNYNIISGMEKTHFTVYPNESLRIPSILMLFWEDDILTSHNTLKRLIKESYTPKPSGKPVDLPVSFLTWGGLRGDKHLKLLDILNENEVGFDCYWIDAGWYGTAQDVEETQNLQTEDWYGRVGNWCVNKVVHTNGLKVITEKAHNYGMRTVLWIESERTVTTAPITKEHPEWFLHLSNDVERFTVGQYEKIESLIINLGNKDARLWLTDTISNLLTENGIDIYRTDMNTYLNGYWEYADKPDRIGVSEMKYIEGWYLYLDELIKRHPNLLIDNTAGGGRRLDIEMARRSIPMWRSDYACKHDAVAEGGQLQGYNLMHWLPYSCTGSNVVQGDTYKFRSDMTNGINFNSIIRNAFDILDGKFNDLGWLSKMLSQHKRIKQYFSCDFYPLTKATESLEDWYAFQLNDTDLNSGIILVFRREKSQYVQSDYFLNGIDDKSNYQFENFDTGEIMIISGKELLEQGFKININSKRESALFEYKKYNVRIGD